MVCSAFPARSAGRSGTAACAKRTKCGTHRLDHLCAPLFVLQRNKTDGLIFSTRADLCLVILHRSFRHVQIIAQYFTDIGDFTFDYNFIADGQVHNSLFLLVILNVALDTDNSPLI